MKRKSIFLITGILTVATIGCSTQDAFLAADTNKDGAVSSAEFDTYMKSEVFTEVDADKDGRVTMTEWQAVNPGKPASEFKKVDRNGDGAITRAEADAEFDRTGSLDKLFKKIDTDGNGSLSREEAKAFGAKVKAQPGASGYEKLSNAAN